MGAKWRLAAVTGLLVLATACGSSDNGGDKVASLGDNGGDKGAAQNSANDGKTDEDRFRDYRKCMREQGVDMPEPKADGSAEAMEFNESKVQQMEKAGEVCNKILPNGGKPKPLSPEELDKQRQQAKCMREHGVNMPDPDPNNPGMGITLEANGDKEKMDKAFKECGLGVAVGGRTGGGN
ncbi:hypothetical protein [Kibdelosporangium phytohabitans]|uniref:Lipoprotein n=1 Tax=Kibdelosporangium phytohabitans TaxID=860235 RepID=A0A0N9HP04_9PSEU|nr:hypothetical protein [Kibdelosporangium phytohabitans]ALG06058.1 hypothetical protein AOZ06_03215 [Kibdelosporangium phytohabitans]MBE1465862.1 hypothetical protein [Kibdelosporangium phytohabitans]